MGYHSARQSLEGCKHYKQYAVISRGLISGSVEGLLWGQAQRVSSRHKRHPLGVGTEVLLSSSEQSASSRHKAASSRHQVPPPRLGAEDPLSAWHRGSPLGLAQRASGSKVGGAPPPPLSGAVPPPVNVSHHIRAQGTVPKLPQSAFVLVS